MHPLLATLTGKTAVNNYRQHLRDARKSVKKIQAAFVRASSFPETVVAARDAFLKAPTDANLDAWASLEAKRTAMFHLNQDLSQTVSALMAERMRAGGAAKLRAAADEVEAALIERRALIVAEDEKRSVELGETVGSGPALAAIDKMLSGLISARAHAEHLFEQAMSTFNTIIGPDPEQA